MGYIETWERYRSLQEIRELFRSEIKPFILVEDKMDLGVWYCAATNPSSNKTICFIYKYSWDKSTGKVCYKDMDESVGPLEYKPSKKILKALSPTDNTYAIEWRKKCWEQFKIKN